MPVPVADCSAAIMPSAQSKAVRAAGTFSIRPAISTCSPTPPTRMRTSRAGGIAPRPSESTQAIAGMATSPTRLCPCSHIPMPPDRTIP